MSGFSSLTAFGTRNTDLQREVGRFEDGPALQRSQDTDLQNSATAPYRRKIACVAIPDFAVEVCQRACRQSVGAPLALAESALPSAEVIACNGAAIAAGLLLHITAAQAHVLCPHLIVKIRDIEREIEQSNTIYKKLQNLSPFVEEARPGLYFLDASGFELLYRDDTTFAAHIIATARACHNEPYPVRVGIAANKFVAQLAADGAALDGYQIVPNGNEGSFLRDLPVTHLGGEMRYLGDDLLEYLHDLGLRTVGQVAAFPSNELTRRFGVQGECLARLARGDDPAFFTPEAPTEPLSRTAWFDQPLERREMIAARIAALLEPLLEELGRYREGCTTVEVSLHPDGQNSSITVLTLGVERPTLSLRMFLDQFRSVSDKQRLTAPVLGITVTIPGAAALLTEQLPLDDRFGGQVSPLLSMTVHTGQRVMTRPFFLPEEQFTCDDTPSHAGSSASPGPVWAYGCVFTRSRLSGLRLYGPPRPIIVQCEGGQPVRLSRTPVDCDGPWELSGYWWSGAYDRRYFEVRTRDRRRFLIFHDRLADRWFLQGVFD